MNKTSFGLLLVVSMAAACKEKTADTPKAPDAAAQVVPPPRTASVTERMSFEAKNRPRVKITAEQAIAAIDGAGLQTIEPKQVIAGDVGSKYCLNAHVARVGYVVVACEFDTPEAAERGRELQLKLYPASQQEILVNETTTLNVVGKRPVAPAADEYGKKIIEAFKALK